MVPLFALPFDDDPFRTLLREGDDSTRSDLFRGAVDVLAEGQTPDEIFRAHVSYIAAVALATNEKGSEVEEKMKAIAIRAVKAAITAAFEDTADWQAQTETTGQLVAANLRLQEENHDLRQRLEAQKQMPQEPLRAKHPPGFFDQVGLLDALSLASAWEGSSLREKVRAELSSREGESALAAARRVREERDAARAALAAAPLATEESRRAWWAESLLSIVEHG